MRILTITNCPLNPAYGSGKTVLHFSQGLRDLGHNVQTFEPKNYLFLARTDRAKQLRTAIGADRLVNRKLRQQRFDVLEFYGGEFGYTTWRWSKRRKPLIVAHTNGLELLAMDLLKRQQAGNTTLANPSASTQPQGLDGMLMPLYERLYHSSFAHANAFVALCELDRKYVVNKGFYPQERTAVVEPGLDQEYLQVPFSPDREERVAFTGGWTPRKGLVQLVNVMSKILTERPNLHFDIYGSGMPAQTVQEQFPADVRSQIHVYPRLTETEIANGLSRAKVFFFPTQYEGFGIALAEAMACGCACVTTRTGFGAELEDGKEVVLCDFTDEAAMEAAVKGLLDNPDLRNRIAMGGWQRARPLTWESNVRKLDEAYRSWVQQSTSK